MKAARRDAGRVRRQDDLAARYSGDTVVALQLDACPEARRDGLGPDPKGRRDGQEIVAREAVFPQDVVHRALQPQDALPQALPAPRRVL